MLYRSSLKSLTVLGLSAGALLFSTPAVQAQSAPIDEKAFADGVVSYERGTSNNWNSFFGEANSSDEQ